MFFENWMEYITDDAPITRLAIPASHNSATKGMFFLAECQGHTLREQYEHGVRFFDLRLKQKGKKIYIGHAVSTGITFEEALKSIREIIDNYDDFIFLEINNYPNQPVGPVTLHYQCDINGINGLIKKYLEPEKYALGAVEDINSLTMGDIRKSGKRFLITDWGNSLDYCTEINLADPWNGEIFGCKPEKFCGEVVNYLKTVETEGMFRSQTQLTPGPGTENGYRSPKYLSKLMTDAFPSLMDNIASDPFTLEKVNVVSGDYMASDTVKSKEILRLNLLKKYVRPEMTEDYNKNTDRSRRYE